MSDHPDYPRRRRRRPRAHRTLTRLPVVDETSAGGVVIKVHNGRAYVALIARRNRHGSIEWCLPKGHVEGRETTADTAIREVFEETGITGRIIVPLATISYSFSGAGRWVHKVVHHYLMEYVSGTITVEGDPDQEAEEAAWFPLSEAETILVYPNERKVAHLARQLLRRRT
ncbi:NUDIX hydrolase [Nanchangia anserum]|uniref:NUDIX hydrolase n=1 Tax=Nanchangia anserum TaxID=2692125 RepID=A0A8I0GCN2_9ACTO|nr:NUDIX hydrolase [Nanchangia anserum]MBD3689561.1 NUDIX hydrolase [Nanchangia anserum]QOX81746.1 NUDIX hydrolase [Nanchangia anserum]